MATQTSNFNFIKPDVNDFYNVAVQNENWEKIDAILKNNGIKDNGSSQGYRKMTAVIDLSNSNPDTCVAYADDAVSMTPGSSEWDEFFGHYPVLFKNGVEVGKLNPDNFDQFEDGTTADIMSGDAGDAMICFPKRGVKITTNGTTLTVSMTDDPDDGEFEYYAHTRGEVAKDEFYIGAYKGHLPTSSKLRSLKGQNVAIYKEIGAFRTYAQSNGEGYDQWGFYQLTFMQVMFILKYKTLNSQSKVGKGCINSTSMISKTGGTEDWGMDSEIKIQSDNTHLAKIDRHMKCFGIEDFWGNVLEFIDGIVSGSSREVLTATDEFNDYGYGYSNHGNGGVTDDIRGWMTKPMGTTESGFVAKEVWGSETTYFCNMASIDDNKVAIFGGHYSSGTSGIFSLSIESTIDANSQIIGARLMYL